MTAVEKLLATAQAEVGYLEKASNKNLDNKTTNVGSANYTKYARDLDALGVYNGAKNGYSWCDVFVDWCFITTFGLELGLKMLYQPNKSCGASCTYSSQYYKNNNAFYTKNPKVGDQIFFKNSNGSMAHTGLVYAVDSKYVYTIEGNTSSAAGVVANGGSVNKKKYLLTYNRIAGYGRPNYALTKETKKEEYDVTKEELIKLLDEIEADKAKKDATWGKAVMDKAKAKGIMDGTRAKCNITREEVATILDRVGLL